MSVAPSVRHPQAYSNAFGAVANINTFDLGELRLSLGVHLTVYTTALIFRGCPTLRYNRRPHRIEGRLDRPHLQYGEISALSARILSQMANL
jgi:hypothetical protein